MEQQPNNIKEQAGFEANMKVPPILLEILIYGVEADRDKMKPMMDSILKQIDGHSRKCRALWYIDSGELTVEQKKAKLIQLSSCKYYVFTPENNHIDKKYVATLVNRITKFEKRFNELKQHNIIIKKQQKPEQTEPQIIEEPILHTIENSKIPIEDLGINDTGTPVIISEPSSSGYSHSQEQLDSQQPTTHLSVEK